jgi:hypothetical protein
MAATGSRSCLSAIIEIQAEAQGLKTETRTGLTLEVTPTGVAYAAGRDPRPLGVSAVDSVAAARGMRCECQAYLLGIVLVSLLRIPPKLTSNFLHAERCSTPTHTAARETLFIFKLPLSNYGTASDTSVIGE